MRTPLTDLLGIRLPLIQAPMAGVSTPELAAAVSSAGGLGSIAVGALPAAAADEAIAQALGATSAPINVNVFAHPPPRRDAARETAWLQRLQPWFAEFNGQPPESLDEPYQTFDDRPELLDILRSRRPAVVSVHFGLPAVRTIGLLRDAGICLMATATSVMEARRLAAAGMDVIIAQGFEAGGHRGAFLAAPDEQLATFTLLPRIKAAVDLPVVAAGGITHGAGIRAALAAGAAGAQLGSVFIDTPESAAAQTYRLALREPGAPTAMTSVFSGRPGRALVNRFVQELSAHESAVPDYPLAYDAGKRLAAAASAAGSAAFSPMWAGEGPRREAVLPAATLVRTLEEELISARPPETPQAGR